MEKEFWEIEKVAKLNKDVLSKKEIKFILDLDKKIKRRSEDFKGNDRKMALNVLEKLNRELY